MDNNSSVNIAKKEIQKAIINELRKKGVIDFGGYSNIIKKLDEDIIKLENKLVKKENMTNIVVKILV